MCYITVKKSLEHKQECMYCNQTVQCMGLFHAAPSKTNARNKTLDALMNNTSVCSVVQQNVLLLLVLHCGLKIG